MVSDVPPQLLEHCFTSNNAAAMQARGELVKKAERALNSDTKQAFEAIACEHPAHARLVLIEEQITRIRERLNSKDCSDKDRAALGRTLCQYLDVERDLRGIPKPKPQAMDRPLPQRRTIEPTVLPTTIPSGPGPEPEANHPKP